MRSAAHGRAWIGGGCCVRQNHVVLAPVAGAKSAEVHEPDRASLHLESADDGGKTNSSPGRAWHKPLRPLRRECRVSGVPVVTTVCLLLLHTGCGCGGHPAFPCALY